MTERPQKRPTITVVRVGVAMLAAVVLWALTHSIGAVSGSRVWNVIFLIGLATLVGGGIRKGLRGVEPRNPVSGSSSTPTVSSFRVIGGHGFALVPTGATCDITCTADGLSIVTSGRAAPTLIPYEGMIDVEVAGGVTQNGGGFFGGGFGVQGALEGMAVATMLNALTTKTKINTVLRIATQTGELFLHHGAVTPANMRVALSPLFTRVGATKESKIIDGDAAAGPDPATQLEQLTRLRDAGALTPEEFETARAPLVAKLLGS